MLQSGEFLPFSGCDRFELEAKPAIFVFENNT